MKWQISKPLDKYGAKFINEHTEYLLSYRPLMDEDHPHGERDYILQSSHRYEQQMKLIGDWTSKRGGGPIKVLDVGCYPGHLAMLLRYVYDAEVMGVGVTQNQLFTRRMTDCNINFKHQDVEKEPLPYPDGYFDLVLFTEIIEHLFNPFLIGKEIARVLKMDGAMLLSTPNASSLRSRIALVQGKIINPEYFWLADQVYNKISNVNEYPIHVHLWMLSELRLFIDKIGLTVVEEKYLNYPFTSDQRKYKEIMLRLAEKLLPVNYRDMVTIFSIKKHNDNQQHHRDFKSTSQ